MIPKKIHFVWLGEIPAFVGKNIKTWMDMNPEYEVVIHGESSLSEFYQLPYSRTTNICSKSDLVRLSVLERYGGWYFDCDFIPLVPVDEMIEDHKLHDDFFITKQWTEGPKRFANGILGVGSQFKGWSLMHELIEKELYARRPLERTTFGPLLLTKFVEEYKKVTIGEWQNFYFHRTKVLSLEAYKKLQAGRIAEALPKTHKVYTIHLWLGGNYSIPELEGKVA